MLQTSEYRAGPYLRWLWRTGDFSRVSKRGSLKLTNYARLLLIGLVVGIFVELAAGVGLIVVGIVDNMAAYWELGISLMIAYPVIMPNLIVLPLEIGRLYIVEPKQKTKISRASAIFASHPGVKIAVAGSYGKTTMKEVLKTVLSEGKTVAATEANHNVAIEHAKFASRLKGDEQILIIEYGEGAPGDVKRFAANTHPTHGVITGLAPAHLNNYKTMAAVAEDIFSIASYLKAKNIYVNGDSDAVKPYLRDSYIVYGSKGVANWRAVNITVSTKGISFKLKRGHTVIDLNSKLIGRHQVGVLSLAAVLAMELGLTDEQIKAGIAKTAPFEHRMQPYELDGALVIDDTYNGNIDGIKAGTQLLSELKANRKIYVTPGLVEQGSQSEAVHKQMGELIAKAKPDIVVLMRNSVTDYILAGLKDGGYHGETRIETDPLGFYNNLSQFVAEGDLVLMQNDWPDNYA